jgi:DNA (cytosine-5)-methyltransferase 1
VADGGPGLSVVDLFCGAGGLSFGLQLAGLPVIAGVDIDPHCRYPFEANIDAPFLERDVADVTGDQLTRLWIKGSARVLAGCAPCQPFSPYRRGADTSSEGKWPLLDEFGRLASETLPEIVTMENVPRIGGTAVFRRFVANLERAGYQVDWRSCNCLKFGLPQQRRRLVLLASRLGPIEVPAASGRSRAATVRSTIGRLPAIPAGGRHARDRLHVARSLTDLNLRRIRASTPGGTWEEWPRDLRARCHRRSTGATFRNVYARMEWDKPAPTITTLAHNFGTGRFGHPEQDRAISLREAAMLQGFPRNYRFVRPGDEVYFDRLGRLIGNAVPPPLARAVGESIREHLATHSAA